MKKLLRSEKGKMVVSMMKIIQSLKLLNHMTIILCLCAYFCLNSITSAQWTTDSKKDILDSKSDLKSMMQMPVTNAPALEGPVDPEKYFIGPSDVLSVNIWISPPLNFSLTVTPEGTLIIPTVGEVRITDLTLGEAKKRIIDEIKKKYITGSPTVTLLSPRQITVTVTGAIRYPGKYVLNATDRVDKAIAKADEIQKDRPLESGENIEDWQRRLNERKQSKRDIHLTRRTGENYHADILLYYATQNDKLNPLLREGDEIFVPRIDPKKNVFAVYGGVNVQGIFELVEGDSLLDAIELAYGFTARAQTDSIVLYRYNVHTGKQNLSYYNFNQVKNGYSKNVKLIAGDRIVVKEPPDVREDYRVFLEGEVQYPGIYPITKDSTSLLKVIEWAGGFTEYASFSSAQVYRGTISRYELEIEKLLSLRGNITPEDSAYYLLESELRTKREVVDVDFKKLFIDKDSTEDVYLRNGDVISIPSIRRTIYVFGQVINPGNIQFVPGMDYKYYIQKCSGYTENARSGDVMIIKRATRQWLSPKETKIEEGDYVWIPKEPQRSFAYYMNIFNQTAAVITAAVSLALLAIQLRR
jgi:protein involved in polysaccharide export with SLBB domain